MGEYPLPSRPSRAGRRQPGRTHRNPAAACRDQSLFRRSDTTRLRNHRYQGRPADDRVLAGREPRSGRAAIGICTRPPDSRRRGSSRPRRTRIPTLPDDWATTVQTDRCISAITRDDGMTAPTAVNSRRFAVGVKPSARDLGAPVVPLITCRARCG